MNEKFFPDIFEHFDNSENKKSVTCRGLEEYVLRLSAATGLSKEISKEITRLLFQEMRNAMIRGEVVTIRGIGKFLLAKPSNSSNKKKVFAKFKPYPKLLKKMNNGI